MPNSLVVIGAGPGGYTAAFRAADLGLNVTLIDTDTKAGGVCLNRGCIPSKALLHAAKSITEAADAKNMGVTFNTPSIDIEKLRAWKDGVVTKLTGGLGQLAKARKISFIQGEAKFLNATTLEIRKPDGIIEQLTFEHAIIATGSRPVELSFLPRSHRVWDSTDALTLPHIPPTLLIIGGGYIGLELGTAYAALGSKVSVVEALPSLLSSADKDLADIVIRRLKKTFTAILCGTKLIKAEETSEGIRDTILDDKNQEKQETYAQVLVSVGRKPNTHDLGLEKTSIKISDKGFIEVDGQRRTAEAKIFAIGDTTGQPMLAHKASAEAKVAADAVAGYPTEFAPKCIASVVYTDPELAWCGITEQEAHTKGLAITISKFPWMASGRAMTLGRTDGLTKIIADTKTGKILGVGIAGVNAGELIAEGALAIETGIKAEDLELTIHPHPTLSEMMMETAEGLFGHPTHLLKPKQ
jgi:dihydrolipoamide dehydrogenase